MSSEASEVDKKKKKKSAKKEKVDEKSYIIRAAKTDGIRHQRATSTPKGDYSNTA